MSAAEAVRALGVQRATLYAYVSRGLIRSQPGSGRSRERRYAREDVERLRRRSEERRDPAKAAAHALQWGMPVLESSITLIAGDTLHYRGHDVPTLARTASVEAVASLVWTGRLDEAGRASTANAAVRRRARRTGATSSDPFIVRAQAALALASADDPPACDLRPEAVVRTAWRILDVLVALEAPVVRGAPLESVLVRGWGARGGVGRSRSSEAVVRAALILCADHELNVSAFVARCVASAQAHPYAVVIAGLAALDGAKHGGSTARVESLLASLRRARSLGRALAERLRQGSPIEGFGHRLYPNGDPRARALLALLAERYPGSSELRYVHAVARAGTMLTGESPNLDFALAAVSRVLGLPPSTGLTLFAIGRTIGWIGHALEQYAVGELIRPRARYVGVSPGGD